MRPRAEAPPRPIKRTYRTWKAVDNPGALAFETATKAPPRSSSSARRRPQGRRRPLPGPVGCGSEGPPEVRSRRGKGRERGSHV